MNHEEKFLDLFKEALDFEDREVKMNDQFRLYAEWDSLSRLSLIAMMDEEYSVQIEEVEFNRLQTVGDIYERVTNKE